MYMYTCQFFSPCWVHLGVSYIAHLPLAGRSSTSAGLGDIDRQVWVTKTYTAITNYRHIIACNYVFYSTIYGITLLFMWSGNGTDCSSDGRDLSVGLLIMCSSFKQQMFCCRIPSPLAGSKPEPILTFSLKPAPIKQ